MTEGSPATLSFNEVAALAAKAARGSGLGWGHAEDLGRAARWLAERGHAWDAALCELLAAPDAAERTSRLVAAGDRAAHAPPGATSTLDGPGLIWLLPIVSAALFGRPNHVAIRSAIAEVHLSADGAMATRGEAGPLATGLAGPVTIAVIPAGPVPEETLRSRPEPIGCAALATLAALADRTLVPASDLSRRGAGGTLADND